MSREEVVFTKKAIVVVAVISVLGSNAVFGFMAAMWLWRFTDQVKAETIAATTAAATQASSIAVQPLREEFLQHKSGDEKTEGRLDAQIQALKDRQDKLEERVYRRVP